MGSEIEVPTSRQIRIVAVTASSGTLTKHGNATLAGDLGDDLACGTWNSIKRQAGLKE